MIRVLVEQVFQGGKSYVEVAGLSTDEKPVAGLITGSKFTEVDTGDVYLFSEVDPGTWSKVAAGYTAG